MFNTAHNNLVNHLEFKKLAARQTEPGKLISALLSCLSVVLLITGCASTKVSTHPQMSANERLQRPGHILVYDFVPAATGQAASEEAQIGREIAVQLTQSIREMGLPAEHAEPSAPVQINDLVFKGSILSLDQGDAAKRVALGFGSGASELKVSVNCYQMTSRGLRQLGGGTGDAGGAKSPGAVLGVAGLIATANPAGLIINTGMKVYGEASGGSKVEGRAKQIVEEIAGRIRPKFQQQGWIQ